MTYRVGFFMSQTAGHVTNYRNLRKVTETDPEITATWQEISYRQEGGGIEKLRDRVVPFIPTYFSGIARASLCMAAGMRTAPYDALFTNDNVAIFFGRSFGRTPTLIDFDSTPRQIDSMPAYGSPNDPAPVARLKFNLWRNHMQRSTLMQAWSNWARQSAINDYGVPPEKIVVNPPGIDLKRWHPVPAQRGSETGAPLRVLFVGGDFRRKGGEHLLEWFRTRQGGPACELHIVTREPVEAGPGVYVYSSMQPNTPELMRLYYLADLFVLPSLGECFGIATVEAMGTGLPVVASDVGGTADIIEPGRNGLIVPAANTHALGEAIEHILGDTAMRHTMGHNSRKLAEQRFDMQVNARHTLGYLKQIAHTAFAEPHQASVTKEV